MMVDRVQTVETLLGRLESHLKPEFAQFLRDLANLRSEKIALECLVDGLNNTGAQLGWDVVRDLDAACRLAGVDDVRRLIVGKLMLSAGGAGAAGDGRPGVSLAQLVASDDPVALGRAHGVSEAMLVRALREKHGISLGEAVALLQMIRPQD